MISKTKVSLFAAMAAATLTMQAQTKMMRLHNVDGTSAAMSVAELQRISFLAPGVADKGMTMTFTDGSFVTVYFCDEPSVSFGDGFLTLTSAAGKSPVTVSFEDVADLTLGELASVCAPGDDVTGITLRILSEEALFSGVPDGAVAEVFAVDGHAEGIYPAADGVIAVRRDSLGARTHIVRIGTFSVKINL